MKIEDGRIVSCTRIELYDYWLKRYSDIYPFPEFRERIEALGTVVKEDEDGQAGSDSNIICS